jgi:hypothetical protein
MLSTITKMKFKQMIINHNGLNIQRRQTVAEIRNTKKTLGRMKKGIV